nr:unnamed protein product [Bacillus licheniformis]
MDSTNLSVILERTSWTSFKAFAELCITRQIITAIKTATRQKHIPLNSYVSLDKPIYDEESDRTLLDVISGAKVMNPEELIINQRIRDIELKMGELLSDLERKVPALHLDGRSYQEISEELNRHVNRSIMRSSVSKKLESTWSSAKSACSQCLWHIDSHFMTVICYLGK